MVRIIWYNTYSQVKILTDGVTKEIFILDQLNDINYINCINCMRIPPFFPASLLHAYN